MAKHLNENIIYKSIVIFIQMTSLTNVTLAAKLSIREYALQSTFHAENTKNSSENQAPPTQSTRGSSYHRNEQLTSVVT